MGQRGDGETWWDIVRHCETWWDIVRHGETWWEMHSEWKHGLNKTFAVESDVMWGVRLLKIIKTCIVETGTVWISKFEACTIATCTIDI